MTISLRVISADGTNWAFLKPGTKDDLVAIPDEKIERIEPNGMGHSVFFGVIEVTQKEIEEMDEMDEAGKGRE